MNWTERFLGILAVCAVLQLIVNFVAVGQIAGVRDEQAEYKRAKLEVQSKAHAWIRTRISPAKAGEYFEWLQKNGGLK